MAVLPGVSMITRAPTIKKGLWSGKSGGVAPCDLNHQAAHVDDPAMYLDAVEFVKLFGQRLHAEIGL